MENRAFESLDSPLAPHIAVATSDFDAMTEQRGDHFGAAARLSAVSRGEGFGRLFVVAGAGSDRLHTLLRGLIEWVQFSG